MNKTYGLLREFGNFVIAHIHHTGYSSENILYEWARIGEMSKTQGALDEDGFLIGRDKILCVDTPNHLQKVEVALRKISDLREKCVRFWFCAPLRPDGQFYTKAQLARILRINKGKFKAELKKGLKDLDKLL